MNPEEPQPEKSTAHPFANSIESNKVVAEKKKEEISSSEDSPKKEHPFQKAAGNLGDKIRQKADSKSKQADPFARSKRSRKLSSITVWAIIAGLLVGGLAFYFLRSGKGEILVTETDPQLAISLNNRGVQATKEKKGYRIQVFAGEYRIVLQKPKYTTFTQDISVQKGKVTIVRPAFQFQPTSTSSELASIDFVRPSADGKTLFYAGDNRSTLYRMEIATQERVPLTIQPLSAVTDVQWSSNPTVALVTRPDGVYLREIPAYDFQHQSLVKVGGTDVISPIWDPLNPNRVAFAYQPRSGERSLVFADKRLSQLDRKADISAIPNPKIIWSPKDSYVLLIARSSDPVQNNAWIYNAQDGSLRQLTNTGEVNDASFSPDEGHILIQTGNSTLSLIKPDGSSLTSLPLQGRVATSAWKDSSTLLLPAEESNRLTVYHIDGSTNSIAFTFPTQLSIRGLLYFKESDNLIIYTETTIYTVDLNE